MKKIILFLAVVIPLLAACSSAKNPVNPSGDLPQDESQAAEVLDDQVLVPEEIVPDMQVVDVPGSEEPVFCTMDAKICPDGSFVGRSGPNCEFDPCPEDSTQE